MSQSFSFSCLLASVAVLFVTIFIGGVFGDKAFQSVAVYSDSGCSQPFVPPPSEGIYNTPASWGAIDSSNASTGQTNTGSGNTPCVVNPYTSVASANFTCLSATNGVQSLQLVAIAEYYNSTTCSVSDASALWVFNGTTIGSCLQGRIYTYRNRTANIWGRFTCGSPFTNNTNNNNNSATTARISIIAYFIAILAVVALLQ